ncbi:isocitrate lyase/PEP mutase family protein [Brevibacillus sp. NRS-1366]|uniref:isocitrate lyase/PEP mutase family protein n=1 Tax=Brevibacillus sp. NRS-1366 TaxID=3233899 RepID=UPI003D241C17
MIPGEKKRRSATEKRWLLRELLQRKSLTVMPGGFSPLYARVAEEAGFETFFLAGSQLSAFLYGVPDSGIIGLRDLVDHARHMAARTNIPIFIDADTGFGNAVNVHYAVTECIHAGVAGVQIEDQESPKKSGISSGRRCITIEEAVGKYRAAISARDALDPSFVICARTDALGAENSSFEEALDRCIAYVQEGGVDFIWLNSVQTREQLARACKEIPAPVLTIWGGAQPAPTLEEYEQLGVRIALYPTLAASSGLQAAWHVLHDFRSRGTEALLKWGQSIENSPFGRAHLDHLTGAAEVRELEELYLPESVKRNYESTWGHKDMLASVLQELQKTHHESNSS